MIRKDYSLSEKLPLAKKIVNFRRLLCLLLLLLRQCVQTVLCRQSRVRASARLINSLAQHLGSLPASSSPSPAHDQTNKNHQTSRWCSAELPGGKRVRHPPAATLSVFVRSVSTMRSSTGSPPRVPPCSLARLDRLNDFLHDLRHGEDNLLNGDQHELDHLHDWCGETSNNQTGQDRLHDPSMIGGTGKTPYLIHDAHECTLEEYTKRPPRRIRRRRAHQH